jgi:hypothetical protein
LIRAGTRATGLTYEELLERPIAMEEIRHALRTGGCNKTSGSDGISLEFYKANWTVKDDLYTVINQMYMGKTITAHQKHGVIVCLPKYSGAQRPTDFRPITLLNVDYKILARILVHRLRPLMAEQLQETQFCGVPGNIILEAATKVREVIALAEVTRTPCACYL